MIKIESIELDLDWLGKGKLLVYSPLVSVACWSGWWRYLVLVIVALGVFEITFRKPFSIWTKIAVFQTLGLLTILSFPVSEAWWLFLTVFTNDAGALYGGTYLNRFSWMRLHIFPVSPNKTLGGFLYGVLASWSIGILLVDFLILPNYYLWLLPAICCVATVGDLLGSGFKRHYDLKDSGQGLFTEKWMCGHGGILDRFDSLPAVCFFWLFFKLLN